MKVRWQFYFEYENLKFEKKHTYGVQLSKEDAEAFGLPPQEFEAAITIESDEEEHGSIRQRGIINIILPGDNEKTKDLAYSLASSLADHITFSQERIKIDWSLVMNELLPETPEEETELGENRFSWTVQVRKVLDGVPFDSSSLQRLTNNPLLKQFNEANNARSSIDRFIGLFKILEDLYGSHPLKRAFKSSTELRQVALQNIKIVEGEDTRPLTQAEFENLVDDLVNTRHECAHLNRSTGFGITYGDSRVQSNVEPLLVPLEILARESVKRRIV
jgi:hypothetical protein